MRESLAQFVITPIQEIVAEYAVYTEAEKLALICAQTPDGGCVITLEAPHGYHCQYGIEWMKVIVVRSHEVAERMDLRLYNESLYPRYIMVFGNSEGPCIYDRCMKFDELLPSFELNLPRPEWGYMCLDIIDVVRADYIREMRERMDTI